MILASKNGGEGTVKLLFTILEVDGNVANRDGDTAIEMGAGRGPEAVVRVVLAAPGIDVSVRSTDDGHVALASGSKAPWAPRGV